MVNTIIFDVTPRFEIFWGTPDFFPVLPIVENGLKKNFRKQKNKNERDPKKLSL